MADEKIVMRESDDAATYRTDIKGWVSRHGVYFGTDESTARYDGATHQKCRDCDAVIPVRGSTVCAACSERLDEAKHAAREAEEWDGVSMLYLDRSGDRFFLDLDDVLDYCDANDIDDLRSLRLLTTEPVYASQIDPNEHYVDDLSEDGEVPDEIGEAFVALNAAIEACHKPLSWMPTEKRAVGVFTDEIIAKWNASVPPQEAR